MCLMRLWLMTVWLSRGRVATIVKIISDADPRRLFVAAPNRANVCGASGISHQPEVNARRAVSLFMGYT
jgi:hypothetical protein